MEMASDIALEQIDEHQVIYIHDNTVILADGDDEVQYVIPSEMVDEENVVQEDGDEQYLTGTSEMEQLEENNETTVQQKTEEADHVGEVAIDEHQVFAASNDESEVVTEVVLNEEQCRMLQGCGYVFFQQGSQRFFLDGDGLREIDYQFDENEIENVEYLLPDNSQDDPDDPEEVTEEDQSSFKGSENDLTAHEHNVKEERNLEQLVYHQESIDGDTVAEDETDPFAELSHIKLEHSDVDIPMGKRKYAQQTISPRTPNPLDKKLLLENTDKRIGGKRRQLSNMNQIIGRQETLSRYNQQKGKKRRKILQKATSITSDDIVNLLKTNKIDRNDLEQVKRNGRMYIGDTPDGRRIYGRVIEVMKQSSVSETSQNGITNGEVATVDLSLLETALTSESQNRRKTTSSIETGIGQAGITEHVNIKQTKSSNEKKILGHIDIVERLQSSGQKIIIGKVPLQQPNSDSMTYVLQPSDIMMQTSSNTDIHEDHSEDSEAFQKELASVKKILLTLVKMPTLTELLITRNLMIIRDVDKKSSRQTAYRRESYFPGRMINVGAKDQSADNYQFKHMPALKGDFPVQGYSPVNIEDKESLSCDENFLIIKFTVTTDGTQPTTRIVIMEKKEKLDASNHTSSLNNIDWRPVELDESTGEIKISQPIKGKYKLSIDHNSLECPCCKKRFGRASNLARHMSIHASTTAGNISNRKKASTPSGSAMFVCDKCPCAYRFQSTLTRHMISAHRDQVEIV